MAKKVIVLGIDGMDYALTANLIAQGKLPHFAKLQLKPFKPIIIPQSPVAWTTIATGVNPAKHGIFDFIHVDPKTYIPKLSLSTTKTLFKTKDVSTVQAKAFWDYTTENKIPTTVIRWPVTYPAPKVFGKSLSGMGAPDIMGSLGKYTLYTEDTSTLTNQALKNTRVVTVRDQRVQALLRGPKKVAFGDDVPYMTIPFSVKLDKKKQTAKFTIQEKKYELTQKKWSGYIPVLFQSPGLPKTHGLIKVILLNTEPFSFYVSAIQLDALMTKKPISHPQTYAKSLCEDIGQYSTLGMPEDTDALNDNVLDFAEFYSQLTYIEEERTKQFWHEFNQFTEGLFAFVFDASDRLSHVTWGDANLAPELLSYYEEKDVLLGQLLEKIKKDGDTTLYIVSDHGFTEFTRAFNPNTWLFETGYQTITDVPTPDNQGELYSLVDWSQTQAYAVGFNGININVKGREKRGIVAKDEVAKITSALIKELTDLKDHKTDRNVFTQVYRKEEIYAGPHLAKAPDIILGYNKGFRVDWIAPVGGLANESLTQNTKSWRADHLIDPSHVPGVFFTNKHINASDVHQLDMAPTILAQFNLAIPPEFDGENQRNNE